ncbi:F-box domain - like 10 [Theobroma cacao]|nr:F-box domain - like 10 [Theobroma cacao]
MRWGLRAQAYQREGNSEPEIEESTDSKAKIEEVVAEGSICGNPEPEIEETDAKVDRITSLPKEVMAEILSRLTLEEAVRTSILSSKWRLSSTHFRGFLDFDASAKVNVMSPSILGGENDAERLDFRTWVNGILQSLRAPTIKGL